MPTLTVFLAPDGPATGVLDVLTDLSAAALVEPFLWVSGTELPAGRIPAVVVHGGRRTPTTVDEVLADGSYPRRRLCVVVPLAAGTACVGVDAEQRLRALLASAGGDAAVTPVRVIVSRPGDHAVPELLGRVGWHNIFLAPEDARGPGEAHELLGPSTDPVEIGRCAAPAIAGLVGLWTGNDQTPLDRDDQPPQGVRAARAFYRRIDASPVENELRRRVLRTDPPPVPRDRMVTAFPFSEPRAVCHVMAGRWWDAHRSALIGERVRPEPARSENVGALALITQFFAFLWSQFRPAAWWAGLVTGSKVLTAKVVHNVVLGSRDKAYDVIVRGMSHTGLPVGWRELGAATGRIDDQLVASGYGAHAVRPDLRRTWNEFAWGALTLVDAGRRGPVEPEREDRTNPGVLRSTADAAPVPDQRFTDIPGHLQAALGDHVLVGDVLGAEVLRRRLWEIERQDPVQASDAGRARQSLGVWEDQHRHTYSVQVGGVLAEHLLGIVEEIRGYLRWLDEHSGAADEAEPTRSRFVTWMLRFLTLLAVVGLVLAPVLAFRGVLSPVRAVLLAVLPVGVWLAFGLTTFIRERREVFRVLARRRQVQSELAATRANLRQATIDVRRLTDAYEQYLVWSQVVGAVLHDPFGPLPVTTDAGTLITYGLPRTTRVAQAELDEHAVGAAVTVLRSMLYGIGWLSGPWQEHLRGAGREIRRYDLLDDNWEGILDLRGGVAESALRQWAEHLAHGQVSPETGRRAWAVVMAWLDGPQRQLADTLLSAVRGVGHGEQRAVSVADFLAGVDGARDQTRQGQEFDGSHFTSEGRAAQRATVVEHHRMPAKIGLSRIEVLVQLGVACPEWQFAVTERRRDDDRTATVAVPAFPQSSAVGAYGDGYADRPVDEVDRTFPPHTTAIPDAPRGYS